MNPHVGHVFIVCGIEVSSSGHHHEFTDARMPVISAGTSSSSSSSSSTRSGSSISSGSSTFAGVLRGGMGEFLLDLGEDPL